MWGYCSRLQGPPLSNTPHCFLGGAGGAQGGGIVRCQKLDGLGTPIGTAMGTARGERPESRDLAEIVPGIFMGNPWALPASLNRPHAGVPQGHRCGVLGGTTLDTPGAGKCRGRLPNLPVGEPEFRDGSRGWSNCGKCQVCHRDLRESVGLLRAWRATKWGAPRIPLGTFQWRRAGHDAGFPRGSKGWPGHLSLDRISQLGPLGLEASDNQEPDQ